MSESEYSRTVKWLSRARELERRIEARTEQAERLAVAFARRCQGWGHAPGWRGGLD